MKYYQTFEEFVNESVNEKASSEESFDDLISKAKKIKGFKKAGKYGFSIPYQGGTVELEPVDKKFSARNKDNVRITWKSSGNEDSQVSHLRIGYNIIKKTLGIPMWKGFDESVNEAEFQQLSQAQFHLKAAIKDQEKENRIQKNDKKFPQPALNHITLTKVLGRGEFDKKFGKIYKALLKKYKLKESVLNEKKANKIILKKLIRHIGKFYDEPIDEYGFEEWADNNLDDLVQDVLSDQEYKEYAKTEDEIYDELYDYFDESEDESLDEKASKEIWPKLNGMTHKGPFYDRKLPKFSKKFSDMEREYYWHEEFAGHAEDAGNNQGGIEYQKVADQYYAAYLKLAK